MANASIKAVITAEDRASSVLKGFSNTVEGVGRQALNLTKRLVQVGSAAIGAASALGVKTAAELESARMGFVTLLGSAEKADKTLARIKQEAARTPFEMVGLTQATQLLSSVTKDGDRALNFILDIGEGLAAMGRGQAELDRISVNLQQIAATGRAYGIDIRQFAFAGIPIYEMLTAEIGKTGEALTAFIEEGGVTFELLEKMFAKSTESGGRFFGAYRNQLGTFNQQWSNLKDTLSVTAAEIVVQTGLFQVLKDRMASLGEWVVANKDGIIAFIKGMGVALQVVSDTAGFMVNKIIEGIGFLQVKWGEFTAYINSNETVQKFFMSIKVSLDSIYSTIVDRIIPKIKELMGQFSPEAKALIKAFGYAFLLAFDASLRVLDSVLSKIADLLDKLSAAKRSLDNFMGAANGKNFWESVGNIGKLGIEIGKLALPGFATGGFTGTGSSNEVAGVVHRGEYVVPKNQVNQSTGQPMMGNTTINISVNAGAFTGNPSDARKYAQMILESMKEIAGAKNLTPSQLLGGM